MPYSDCDKQICDENKTTVENPKKISNEKNSPNNNSRDKLDMPVLTNSPISQVDGLDRTKNKQKPNKKQTFDKIIKTNTIKPGFKIPKKQPLQKQTEKLERTYDNDKFIQG